MTDEALQKLWNAYQGAWADIPAEERERLLRQTLTPDVAFTNPDADERGIERMITSINGFQQQYAGCYFRTTLLRQQHGQLLAVWTMFDRNDAPLVNGHSYARFDVQEGRFTHLAGFWKL